MREDAQTQDRHKSNDKEKLRVEGEWLKGFFLLLCLLHTAFFLILAAFCTLWQAGGQAGVGTGKGQRIQEHKKQEEEEEKEEIKKVNKRR